LLQICYILTNHGIHSFLITDTGAQEAVQSLLNIHFDAPPVVMT